MEELKLLALIHGNCHSIYDGAGDMARAIAKSESLGPKSGHPSWDRSDALFLKRRIVRRGNLSALFADAALRVRTMR
jgi:hypothetical protein